MLLRYLSSSSCLLLFKSSYRILKSSSFTFLSLCSWIFCLFALIILSILELLQISSVEKTSYCLISISLVQKIVPNSSFNLACQPSFYFCYYYSLAKPSGATCFIQGWSRIFSIDSLSSGFSTRIFDMRSLHGSESSLGNEQLRLRMLILMSFSVRLFLEWRDEEKGLEPVHNQQIRTPRLQISTRWSCSPFLTIYGDRQSRVPQQVVLLFLPSVKLDHPKSANFASSFLPIKIFSGLMSLWMMFFLCMYSRAKATSLMYLAAFFSSNFFSGTFIRASKSSPFSANSKTKQIEKSSSK